MIKYLLTNRVGAYVNEFKDKAAMFRWLNEQKLPLKGGPYRIWKIK